VTEVVFLEVGGGELRRGARDAGGCAFEKAPPVRSFLSYRGQRNFPGFYYAACMNRHVEFESWLERDEAMAMDFDPLVTAFAPQPFRLVWADTPGRRSHVPDFFARLGDGTGVVVDCRPASRIKPRDQELFDATARICAEVGWEFRLVHGHDPVWLGDVRWLAGYRHRRNLSDEVAGRLVEVFAEPGPLVEGASAVGDPIAVLPVLYHLLWIRLLHTDLTVRLEGCSVVSAG
jgi:TnsA endonuclease-like protein